MKTNFRIYMEKIIHESNLKRKQDVANAIGVHKATFSNWITGRHTPPFKTILQISKLFFHNQQLRNECVFQIVDALAKDVEEKE